MSRPELNVPIRECPGCQGNPLSNDMEYLALTQQGGYLSVQWCSDCGNTGLNLKKMGVKPYPVAEFLERQLGSN